MKNGRSSGNEKALIQNEDCEVFFNDVKCEDEVMEETQEDSSLQIRKVNYYKMMRKKWRKIWNYCIPKGKNGGHIIEMFLVGHSSMWMTMKEWQLMHFKSCNVYFVTLIMCFPLTQEWH